MSHVRTKTLGVSIVLVTLGLESATWAGSPPALRFDPFRDRPERIAGRSGAVQPGPDRVFEPVLLSTVIGGERPVANLGGEILRVGEEVHGYRLLEVRSFEATFEKDGEKIRLEVAAGQGADR